jgi:hypothetical protein
LPCRRKSKRNYSSSPKAALPFYNVFFVVDTGSTYSYLCRQAMQALVGGNHGDSSILCSLDVVELQSGNNILELHLSPSKSHFADVNVLGGSAMAIANLASNNHRNEFSLEYNSV